MRRARGWTVPLAAVAAVCAVLVHASPAGASNDAFFSEQWALTAIHAPDAWAKSTGAGVRIGVIDTGVDLTHEDLASKIVAATSCIGANDIEAACSASSQSAQDDQGHGTHVSGIAAAATGNGKGIAGVAPNAGLVVVKALGSNGSGALNDVNAGIKWAVDHGARVINLSLEADGNSVSAVPGQSLKEGIDYAWSKGAIPVIAAGNATPSLFGQSGYAGINAVIVGATGRANEVAWYSSALTTAQWGIVAPGGDERDGEANPSCAGALSDGCVVSTGWFKGQSNQYTFDEGTSMAAPHVAGVLALLLAQGLTAPAAVSRLLASATKIPCGDACHGLVNAAAAVGATAAAPPTTTTAAPPTAPPTSPPTQPPRGAVTGGSTSPVTATPPTTGHVAPPTTATGAGAPVAHTTPSAKPVLAAAPTGHPGGGSVPVGLAGLAVLLLLAVVGEATLIARVIPGGLRGAAGR